MEGRKVHWIGGEEGFLFSVYTVLQFVDLILVTNSLTTEANINKRPQIIKHTIILISYNNYPNTCLNIQIYTNLPKKYSHKIFRKQNNLHACKAGIGRWKFPLNQPSDQVVSGAKENHKNIKCYQQHMYN